MNFIQSQTGAALISLLALLFFGIVTFSSFKSNDHNLKFAWASSFILAILVFIMNEYARVAGMWDHWEYHLSLFLQLGLICLVPFLLFTIILNGYRFLELRTHYPKFIFGVIIFIILVPATIAGDLYNIRRGKPSFVRGY